MRCTVAAAAAYAVAAFTEAAAAAATTAANTAAAAGNLATEYQQQLQLQQLHIFVVRQPAALLLNHAAAAVALASDGSLCMPSCNHHSSVLQLGHGSACNNSMAPERVCKCIVLYVCVSVCLCACLQLKMAYSDVFKDRSLAPPPKHTLAALGGHAQQKEMLDR
jgi:hypothetical protein